MEEDIDLELRQEERTKKVQRSIPFLNAYKRLKTFKPKLESYGGTFFEYKRKNDTV